MSRSNQRAARRDFTATKMAQVTPLPLPLLALAPRSSPSQTCIEFDPSLVAQMKAAAFEAGYLELLIITGIADISNLDSVKAVHETASNAFSGRLDILINNTAHQEPFNSIIHSGPEVYWRTREVNLHGLFNMTRVFLPMLFLTRSINSGLATMINVSSSGTSSVRP